MLVQRRQELAKQFADRLRNTAEVKMLVETATPRTTSSDRARVFGVVNGNQITAGDIEDKLSSTRQVAQKFLR